MSLLALATALAEPITVLEGPIRVLREPDPVPPQGIFALAPLLALLLLFLAYRLLRRRRRPADLPPPVGGWLTRVGSGSGLGNALVEMNAMFDPGRPVIMMMQSDHDRDPDEVGDDRDP